MVSDLVSKLQTRIQRSEYGAISCDKLVMKAEVNITSLQMDRDQEWVKGQVHDAISRGVPSRGITGVR